MNKNIFIFFTGLLIACQSVSTENTSDGKQISKKDSIINGRSYSPTMIALDKFNTNEIIISGTPTDHKYMDDSTIHLKMIHVTPNDKIKKTDLAKGDSVSYVFTKDTLIITERYFVHGDYGFIPVYSKTDTSISIDIASPVLVDTIAFQQTKEVILIDINAALDSKIITKLFINAGDKKKSIYYKKKKIK